MCMAARGVSVGRANHALKRNHSPMQWELHRTHLHRFRALLWVLRQASELAAAGCKAKLRISQNSACAGQAVRHARSTWLSISHDTVRSQLLMHGYGAQSEMKLLARGRAAAPPPLPAFWAPHQQRACDEDGAEDLIFHVEPLPDDLEPEE